ncbi:phage tail sheath family protein [Jidongwangia harbinensis]|uniref:phage tail sheath family protein n=1 Tax=Jidongwangia harbinensis TaxID=2878561 RepID=UPI001CD9FC9E|nr:phage tail sheath C-terminal domain-containing protein [Jidongwangia harbinensis]MCA2218008.1 phage tail sheath subtilisin-like domain-containing protein [Jidongwangia harbinensis]
MPVSPTFPGVYIDEVPSSVRTIIGVPTAVPAFVGVALRGPVNEPRHITSWADFERIFGGLDASSMMSYVVLHYYQHGGSAAEIVRIAKSDAAEATIDLQDGVTLKAASPGDWGRGLRARVDHNTSDPTDNELWNLTVRDTATGEEESWRNIVADPASPASLDKVLQRSNLVRASGDLTKRPNKQADPPAGTDPFADPAGGAAPTTFVQATGGGPGGVPGDTEIKGSEAAKTGIYALLKTDIFTMLCIPPINRTTDVGVVADAAKLCVDRRAMLIVDPPKDWTDLDKAVAGAANPPGGGVNGRNAALYFPRFKAPDKDGFVQEWPPCGAIAGIWARTDGQRGVWKAPAGTDASVTGLQELSVKLTDPEHGRLNPLGINCLRTFPVIGSVVWGARTLRGADQLANEWKYVPVRRTALFIEETLFRGTQWVVFEPNDEPLWAAIRLNVGAFMNTLFRQGAFQGRTPKDAYLVKCDAQNNPQNDIDRGVVNILVGFAPLKPAEFVLIHIQQLAGQIAV